MAKPHRVIVVGLVAIVVGTLAPGERILARQTGSETRRALLIGIDNYIPPPPTSAPASQTKAERGVVGNLEGTINDVESMRTVLITRYGFKPQNVHVLRNGEATRDRILSEARAWLVAAAAPGDVSLFFYAGHGSQVRNSKSTELDKMDETIVPADANLGRPDIRDKELAGLFDDAIDKKILVTAIFDSCHSGSIVRGIVKPTHVRSVKPDFTDVADPFAPVPPETRGALILSAAQDLQNAGEVRVQEEGNAHHGLFTWALVKTLRTMPVNQSTERLFLSVRSLMQSGDSAQEPVMAGVDARRHGALFGVGVSASTGFVIAVQEIRPDGSVVLQAGQAAGIRTGAELESVSTGPKVTLRVTQEQGLAQSRAEVIGGTATGLSPGALFSVTKWMAAPGQALRVWIDPAAAVPLPPEVLRALQLDGANGPVESLSAIDAADYVLEGRRRNGVAEFAWVRPLMTETDAANSALPASTAWVPLRTDPSALAAQLRDTAVRLSTIRNWLYLESPADSGTFPYHLALKPAVSGPAKVDGLAHDGDDFGLVLTLDEAMHPIRVTPRYVYAFVLGADGSSQLLFPRLSSGNVENLLPNARAESGALPKEIQLLSTDSLKVSPGVDTFVLLTTATALPDPSVLQGQAVRDAGSRGPRDPLSMLLAQGGLVRRDVTRATPTDWSIERFTIRTVAASGKH